MRGYEYYLIDGLDLAMLQTTARLLLFQGVNHYGKLVFIDAFRVQPYKVYLTLHNDWGIVNNPFSVENINPLDNKLLWSYGVGLNIKLYFDMVARIEYSRNMEKGDGIFLILTLLFNMQVAIFSKVYKPKDHSAIEMLIQALHEEDITSYWYKPFFEEIKRECTFPRVVS